MASLGQQQLIFAGTVGKDEEEYEIDIGAISQGKHISDLPEFEEWCRRFEDEGVTVFNPLMDLSE